MLSYSTLRDIQKKESDSAEMTKLEPSFYGEVAIFIAQKKKAAMESGSLLSIKEYENIRRIVTAIQARREEKIALMAVRGESDAPGLTKEESELLKELSVSIGKCRESISGIWSGREGEQEPKKVRILKDIETYTGLDNNVYGPFRSGDTPMLPRSEAEWLLKSRMAEVL